MGDLDALVANIEKHGLINPLTVRPGENGKVRVIGGHRRLEACKLLGHKTVAVVVRAVGGCAATAISMSENSSDLKSNLKPLEEADGFRRVWQVIKSYKKVGRMCGCSDQKVRTSLRLLELPEEVKAKLRAGTISKAAAVVLSKEPSGIQEEALPDMAADTTEGEAKRLVQQVKKENPDLSMQKNTRRKGNNTPPRRGQREVKDKIASLIRELDGNDLSDTRRAFLEGALAALFYAVGWTEDVDSTTDAFRERLAEERGKVEAQAAEAAA